MKQKSIWAATAATLAAAAAIALCGCSSDNDDIVSSNYPTDNVVRVQAGVNAMTTRASYTTSNLREFQISINNTANSTYSYYNVSETKDANTGAWTPEIQMLWQNATQPVDIVATAPVKTNFQANIFETSNYSVPVETKQTADDNSSDFLVYKKTGFVPNNDLNSNGAINIPFKHALSQLVVTITFGTEFDQQNGNIMDASPITDIKVGGTVVDGTCDFTQATPTVGVLSGSSAAEVAPYESADFSPATGTDAGHEVTNAKAEYTCILVPQTVAANEFYVTFTINGKEYTWTSPAAVTLEGGNQYSLGLTVGNDVVVPSSNGMTAKPWTNGTDSSMGTD